MRQGDRPLGLREFSFSGDSPLTFGDSPLTFYSVTPGSSIVASKPQQFSRRDDCIEISVPLDCAVQFAVIDQDGPRANALPEGEAFDLRLDLVLYLHAD